VLKVLKYIIIFLLGYKIISEIFGNKRKNPLPKTPQKQKVNTTDYTNTSAGSRDTFDDAETIEYEELK
jgi:hypothetical protein